MAQQVVEKLQTVNFPVKLGRYNLHSSSELKVRHRNTDAYALTRKGLAQGAEYIAPLFDNIQRVVGGPSVEESGVLANFERCLQFRNAEKFEQPDKKRHEDIEGAFSDQMSVFLVNFAKDFGNHPGDLIKGYQQVLGVYLKEIQYFYTKGENGLGAVQHLISEMVHFGLRGPIMTQIADLQAGEPAKEQTFLTQRIKTGHSTDEIKDYVLKRSALPIAEQGIKDTNMFDMGVIDELMVAIVAAGELGKPHGKNAVITWISSNRTSKMPDDLAFADFALRLAPSIKTVIYGATYLDDPKVLLEEGKASLGGFNFANESLAPGIRTNAAETIGAELTNILLLNPQLFIKFAEMFGDYSDQIDGGDIGKQLLKQIVRDPDFPALTEPGKAAHLIYNTEGVDIKSLLALAGKAFKTPIFTIGNKDTPHRTTNSTDLFGALRDMTNAWFKIKEQDISAEESTKRKKRRDSLIPLSNIASTKIEATNDFSKEKIDALQAQAGRNIEHMGNKIVGQMSLLLFKKASGIIGTSANNEVKQAVADELLVQLMVNTVFASPDAFMPAEVQKKLRKDFGQRIVQTYNLLMADEAVKAKSGMILGTILQYMYQHWDVSEIKDVVNQYKAETVGNSNAQAYTDGKLAGFAMNLLLPDAAQQLNYGEEEEKKQQQLYPVMRSLVGDIAAKMPVWFGRSGGSELIASVFTGTDNIEEILMREWDDITVEGKTDNENGGSRPYPALYKSGRQYENRHTVFTTERAKSMTGTLDILTQLTKIADFLPAEMEIPDTKVVVVETKPADTVVSHGVASMDMIPFDQPRPIQKKADVKEQVPEVKKIKVRPQEEFATTIMIPLIQPIIDIYEEFTRRIPTEVFTREITQLTQLAGTAMQAVNDNAPDIDEHAGKQQAAAKKVAQAKAEVLAQIQSIMTEEGLAKGLDAKVLELITQQSDLIKAQASGNPALSSGVPGMGTALIMAPAAQNDGLNQILRAIAEQSGANVKNLRELVHQLGIQFADVIVDQGVALRESEIVISYKNRHDAALRIFDQASRTMSEYEKQRQEIVKFVQRIAAEQDITIAKLLRQFYDAGFPHLVDWYVAAQNPRAKAKKKEEVK